MEYPNGSRTVMTEGPFAVIVEIENVPCEDGKRRLVTRLGLHGNHWTVPGRVKVGSKTVAGFCTYVEGDGWSFFVNLAGKNAHLIRSLSTAKE
jgi:hypothetical protein